MTEKLRDYLTTMAGGYVRTSEVAEVERLATASLQARLAEAEELLRDFSAIHPFLPEKIANRNVRDFVVAARAFLATHDKDAVPCDTPCGVPGDTVPCNVGPKGHPGNCNHFGHRGAR